MGVLQEWGMNVKGLGDYQGWDAGCKITKESALKNKQTMEISKSMFTTPFSLSFLLTHVTLYFI